LVIAKSWVSGTDYCRRAKGTFDSVGKDIGAEDITPSLGCGTEDGENFLSVRAVSSFWRFSLLLRETGEAGEEEKVLLKLALGRENSRPQRDGLIVERLEVDTLRKPSKNGHYVRYARDARVGQGDPITDPGALARLAVLDGFADRLGVLRPDFFCCAPARR